MDDATRIERVRWVTAKAIALYFYNISAVEWVIAFQQKLRDVTLMQQSEVWHKDYARELVSYYVRGHHVLFGELDFRRQQIQLELIIDRYGEEAAREWSLCLMAVRD